jgi:hypothetical protein
VCWFHGNISREQAEQALHKACEENKTVKGYYLIRFSEKYPVPRARARVCESGVRRDRQKEGGEKWLLTDAGCGGCDGNDSRS